MLGKVYLIRHAEGLHNIRSNGIDILDAPLTQRGFYTAEDLGRRMSEETSNSIGLVISSPLYRAIQTSLLAFSRILGSDQYPANSGRGVQGGTSLALDANLQEIDDIPCNNGTPPADLLMQFRELTNQGQSLDRQWNVKSRLSPLPRRKAEILEKIEASLTTVAESDKRDIAVVTHQGVIAQLTNVSIDMAGWAVFSLDKDDDGHRRLRPT